MERVISVNMLAYLRRNGVITKQQHGFLSGRSTSTNLLETLNDWTLAINDRKSVGVAYVDFAKAFDTVCHRKLLSKLASYGINGQLLKWIESFLSCRTQQTRVGHSLSSIIQLTSGVVQGSVLGPLLFVLFINDITNLFADNNCKCKLFADDLKLYTVLETSADCALLQDKLNELCDWCNKWQLTISYKKCNVMFVGNASYNVSFSINNNCLECVDKVKDLGVIVDANLTFSDHISQVVKRALIRTNLICKCFISRNVSNLLHAFLVFVRPVLEYASCVWSPHYISDIQKIESVQRRFTKRLPGYDTLDYKSRLTKLGIESLETRRLRQDLMLTYKIVFGLVDESASDFLP